MNYEIINKPQLTSNDGIIIGFLKDQPLPKIAELIDQEHNGLASRLIARLNNEGEHIIQSDVNGHSLLLIHCGNQETYNIVNLRKYLIEKITIQIKSHMKSLLISMPQLHKLSADEQLQTMIIDVEAAKYQLLNFKSKNNGVYELKSVQFYLPTAKEKTIIDAKAIADGINTTKNLANTPANYCTPTYLSEQSTQLMQKYPSIKTTIMHRDEMKKLGMNALLAVSQGSVEPPQLIEINYHGTNTAEQPIVLIGKGVTFDSGGISLKSASKMEEMKYDMSGAASVLGVIQACAELKLPVNIVGLMPCTENMPSGSAVKPGDIVTSLSGQTIEIINTDAEGRLILADTLTFAEKFNPKIVIDIATLTGAVIVALGGVNSGLMTPDDDLAKLIINAANKSQDKVWRLPLDDAYQFALESTFADMVNSTETSAAGSISAGCFLSKFAKKYRWAHLDVAGTAWISGKKNGATGRPVALLIQLIRDLINHEG